MKHIFFLILTALALFTCKTDEKPKKQNVLCYVRYDAAQKAVQAEAKFQDETSKTTLEMPGGFRYQGVEMPLLPVYGLTYRYEYKADFLPEHVFEWRDKQNNKQTFSMGIDPIPSFALTGSVISQANPTVLQWSGKALTKGETLVLMWESTSQGLTVPMEVTTTSAAPRIDIPAAKVKELAPGAWTLYLVRKKLVKSTVNQLPINGIMEYYTPSIAVKVTK